MCEDFSPNCGDKRISYCVTTMHCLTLLFSPKNPETVVFHLPYLPDLALPGLFSVSLIEDRTERLPF
jgi:hypothetical protein